MSTKEHVGPYCGLYGFVKDHNKELFAILDDMCAVGLFRPRYPVTFLNPDKKITQKLVDMVMGGESEKAFQKLQSLFIFGKNSSLKGDLVSYNRKAYETDLSSLKKHDKFSSWDKKENVVFDYNLADFPKEGKSASPPKLIRPKKDINGGSEGSDKKVKYTENLFKNLNDDKLMHKVAYNLNSLLEHVKKNDEMKYNELALLMDPNMIVSWFILVQPSKIHHATNPHISDDLFNSWLYTSEVKSAELIRLIFNSDNNNNNNEVAAQSNARRACTKAGFSQTKTEIENAYKDNNIEKLLEDELRFRFSDENEFKPSDINELNNIHWNNPKESLVIVSEPPPACLFIPALHAIMCKFIDSNAFKYTLFNAKIHERLNETISGAGHGNTNVKKMINILGNKNRSFIKNMEKTDENKQLSKFVLSLSKKQVDSLKNLLSGFD